MHLTEDSADSRFFRWVPDVPPGLGQRPDFHRRRLQVAGFDGTGALTGAGRATWIDVDAADPSTYKPTGSTRFVRGEGIWYHDRIVYWGASTFSQIFAYDTRTDEQQVLHAPPWPAAP